MTTVPASYSIVHQARQLAQLLTDAGVPATHDPAVAAANRPIVLVAPPSVDYTRMATTWRLIALAGHDGGTLAALEQLDELVQGAVNQYDLPIEAADPGSYQITPDAGAVPAYIMRATT